MTRLQRPTHGPVDPSDRPARPRLDGATLAITGLGGFIGQRLGQLAQARGATVVGLESDGRAAARARQAGLDATVGSILDPAALRATVGCADLVVHTAALVREGGTLSEARQVNVQGALAVAAAARSAQLVVHLSSVMVYGFAFPDGVTEAGPLRGDDNAYCQTKIEAEAALAARCRAPLAIVRPGDVYGPGSVPWVLRPLAMARAAPLLAPSHTAVFNHVHVDNLCEALLRLGARRLAGVTLNVTDGGGVSFAGWLDRLARWQGRRAYVVPPAVMRAGLQLASRAAAAVGRPAPLDPAVVGFLQRPGRYATQRALDLLGDYRDVPFDDGVAATYAWCLAKGLCHHPDPGPLP